MKEANFKETEIGKIPVDWEVKTLGEFCSTFSGGTPDSKNLSYYNGDINWISSGELNQRLITKTNGFVSQMGIDNSASKIVTKNTFLLAMYGATAGISAITKITGAINQAVLAIVNDRKVSNNYFLLNFFELKKDWIIDTYTQGGQPNLNADIVKKISIPLPPLPEQEKIAELLSDTDLWIESTEALLAKKRQIKKGAMQKLLSPKEDWEVRKLGEVVKITRGASPRPIDNPIWFQEDSKIGWVRISDVSKSNKFLFRTTQKLSPEGISKSRFVQSNSLIMSICATLGKPIITTFDVCIHDGFVVFSDLKIEKEYLYNYLKFIEDDWSKTGQTGSQMNLNTTIINGTEINFPEKAKQQEIAEILSSMDLEIESLENRLQKARQLKQGMMQDLLTGKVRLG